MPDKPMNLLFVFADEMRGMDMRHAGNPDVHTPNLDMLARGGVSFTNAIANCPVCTPSRGTMLTGLHAHKHAAVTNDVPIRCDLPTLGTVLTDADYLAGYIGKWHIDGLPRNRFTPPGPRRLGFDHYWAVWNCHHDYFDGKYYTNKPEPCRITGYEPHIQTELAIRFIERHRNDPFALVLSWGPPHGPLEFVPDEYRIRYDPAKLSLRPNVSPGKTEKWALACATAPWKRYANEPGPFGGDMETAIRESLAAYYAAITALDDDLGRFLSTLEKLELAENTAVVFTSDHGSMHWSHGRIRKQQPWEECILVSCQLSRVGYSLDNFIRAFSAVNCQLTLAFLLFLTACHAKTSFLTTSISSILLFRHCPVSTFNSISAMFSQLPCFGVYTNSNLSHSSFALSGGNVS